MDVAVKVMVTVVNVGMIMVVAVMSVPLELIIMMEDKVLKWVAKVMLQAGEIMVLSMVMDLVVETIIIDYLGCRNCLLVLFMDLSKRQRKKEICLCRPTLTFVEGTEVCILCQNGW